jgi:putative ABC transport system permease protein
VPGVRRAEPFLAVPAVLRSGHRSHRGAVTGLPPDAELTRVLRPDGAPARVPPRGLLLSAQLARMLRVAPGDELLVEPLEGRRRARRLPVAAVVEDYVGVQALAELGWLAEVMGEPPRASGAQLRLDGGAVAAVEAKLRGMPAVAGVTLRASTLSAFHQVVDEFMGIYLGAIGALALAIAAGVVYASARVTWAERERELATLRVVGFTRGEIWRVVAGEIALHLAAAIPAGWAIGLLAVTATARAASTDLYRLPTFVARPTYASAALVVAGGVAAVSLVAVRWIRRLDLVEVLKSRE